MESNISIDREHGHRLPAIALVICCLVAVATGQANADMSDRSSAQKLTLAQSQELPTPQPPPAPNAYYKVFAVGSIEIPRLKVREPIVYGIGNRSLDRGVGWWPGTALPGRFGNIVLGGHRTERSKPFRHINKLRAGDRITVTYRSQRFVYEVRRKFVVDDSDLSIIDQFPGHTITLFSCHPVGAIDQRIVVTGELVETVALR